MLRTPRAAVKDEPAVETARAPIDASLPGIPGPDTVKPEPLLRELLNELKSLRALLD